MQQREITLVKSSCNRLYNVPSEFERNLKEYLTYDNPLYKNAKRYSKYGYTKISPYLTYYSVGDDNKGHYIEYPIGVSLSEIRGYSSISNYVRILDNRVARSVKYPPLSISLRDVQHQASVSYLNALSAINPVLKSLYSYGSSPSLISLPTGKGKTVLALSIACSLKAKTLVLVHKDDLVTGWQKDIDLCFGSKVIPGLIKAKKRVIGDQITIATVQTLNRMKENELEEYLNEFSLVVQDECHHVGLNIFNIIGKFNSKYKLGLSATPQRSDGLNFVFDLFFGGLCYEYKVKGGDEDICGVDVRFIDSGYKYRPFIYKNQVFNYYDFPPEELPEDIIFYEQIPFKDRKPIPFYVTDNLAVLSSATRVKVCKEIIRHYRNGHSCIALFRQKEHINSYYRYLRLYVPRDKIMLYYGDSKEDSSVMMQKAESKEILITLATYSKSTEGTNVKAWEVEFLVSSLNNSKDVKQATGRVRRRKEGKLETAIVYDVRYPQCYSLSRHSETRLKVYKSLGYSIPSSESKGFFKRGYLH